MTVHRIFAGATALALLAIPLAAVTSARAQAPTNTEAISAAKKELVARVLKLQQPGIDNLARQLAEQPLLPLVAPVRAAVARLPADKREAIAAEMEGDARRYAAEVGPIVRDRAMALAPATLGPMIEKRFTEDELRQLITILESPVNARYMAMGVEMQRELGAKVIADTRSVVEPKYKALEQNIQGRLRAATGSANAPAASGGAPGTSGAGGPASGPANGAVGAPGPRASGRGN